MREQPFKIPFVAAIVLAIDSLKTEITAEILGKATAQLQEVLDTGLWRDAKLLLRFLGCLQILFEGDGIFAILEELFGRAVDLQTASSEDVSCVVISTEGSLLICTYALVSWS